jgi:predicted helicase
MTTPQPLSRSSTIDKVSEITKLDIFHYVYAVLHKPEYRTVYEQNLKREFPRIPLYADFWNYAAAGKKLMELHINYELEITNYKPLLTRKDIDLEGFKAKKAGKKKKTSDADKEVAEVATAFTVYPILKIKEGNIEIDELTTLCGVPAQALAYKLGHRSAIEWILDQYKPYKSDDKTIQEKFNDYKFADYKEEVIELLQKVCWLSVETMKIVGEL